VAIVTVKILVRPTASTRCIWSWPTPPTPRILSCTGHLGALLATAWRAGVFHVHAQQMTERQKRIIFISCLAVCLTDAIKPIWAHIQAKCFAALAPSGRMLARTSFLCERRRRSNFSDVARLCRSRFCPTLHSLINLLSDACAHPLSLRHMKPARINAWAPPSVPAWSISSGRQHRAARNGRR